MLVVIVYTSGNHEGFRVAREAPLALQHVVEVLGERFALPSRLDGYYSICFACFLVLDLIGHR